jgi:transcriptional regulator
MPLLYRRDAQKVTLTGHWARPNPQWKDIEGQRVLIILHGPHAYISARWYEDAATQVPTWDYAVAHLYGKVRLLREPAELEDIVMRLAQKYERGAEKPWRYDAGVGRPQLRGIVGFEFEPHDIQLKFKLNQNHPAVNIRGAIAGLESQATDDARAIAKLMQDALESRMAKTGE